MHGLGSTETGGISYEIRVLSLLGRKTVAFARQHCSVCWMRELCQFSVLHSPPLGTRSYSSPNNLLGREARAQGWVQGWNRRTFPKTLGRVRGGCEDGGAVSWSHSSLCPHRQGKSSSNRKARREGSGLQGQAKKENMQTLCLHREV